MKSVEPEVYLIARPSLDLQGVSAYLKAVGGESWLTSKEQTNLSDGELLAEFMGRLCYRSWAPGLNPNVTRIRTDSSDYLENILRSSHGSVLEHASYSFVFLNVSRVFTHELVRHRAGTAISQESMRYVRLTDLPFEHPAYVESNPELLKAANDLLEAMESFQELSASVMALDDESTDFHTKKVVTSAARRYAPDGVATSIGWTANVRALRHIIASRTDPAAEDEIRRVFDQVATVIRAEIPLLLQDFERLEDGTWRPTYAKV